MFGFAVRVSKINVTAIFNMFRINHFRPHPAIYVHFKTNRPQLLNACCDFIIGIYQRVDRRPKEWLHRINTMQYMYNTYVPMEVCNKSLRIRMRNDYPRLVIKPGETAIKRIRFIACTLRGGLCVSWTHWCMEKVNWIFSNFPVHNFFGDGAFSLHYIAVHKYYFYKSCEINLNSLWLFNWYFV